MELYKKHRPRSFRRMIGNTETIAALQNMLKRNRLPQVILFHGPQGCGKTTLARILAKELKCHPMDCQELNAASFRGIDSIREVSHAMRLAPIGPCRIWIFDEVHKWTNDAQNASLKILEDTPRDVYCFLCTTDPQKLISPLISRCTKMPVRLLTYKELERLAKIVAGHENITVSGETLDAMIGAAEGSARVLLVLLDKISNLDEDDREQAIADGVIEQNEFLDLCRALIAQDPWKKVARILQNMTADPEAVKIADPEAIRWSVLGYARAVLLKKGSLQAYRIIDIFSSPFYESKQAGLAAACFEAVTTDTMS